MARRLKSRDNKAAKVEKKPVDPLLAEYGNLQLQREVLVAQLQAINKRMNAVKMVMVKKKEA